MSRDGIKLANNPEQPPPPSTTPTVPVFGATHTNDEPVRLGAKRLTDAIDVRLFMRPLAIASSPHAPLPLSGSRRFPIASGFVSAQNSSSIGASMQRRAVVFFVSLDAGARSGLRQVDVTSPVRVRMMSSHRAVPSEPRVHCQLVAPVPYLLTGRESGGFCQRASTRLLGQGRSFPKGRLTVRNGKNWQPHTNSVCPAYVVRGPCAPAALRATSPNPLLGSERG
jgi:hypothetical protein